MDGEENLCEEQINLRLGVTFSCVDSFRIRVKWKVETRILRFKSYSTLLIFNLLDLLPRSTLIVPLV